MNKILNCTLSLFSELVTELSRSVVVGLSKRNFQLLTIAFFLYPLFSFSQEKFNLMYENEMYPVIRNVFQVADTGYVGLGGTWINNKINIDINYFDTMGNWVWNKTYGNTQYNIYHGAENACIKTEGGYILAGARGQSNVGDTCFIYIVKFNEQFDTLWTKKHFVDTNWVTSRGICNTSDGGYMVVGETKLTNDSVFGSVYQYGLMLKLDAQGNYEWFKSFGTDTHNDNFYKVVQTHDGGYLVGGGTGSWQPGLSYIDQGDWYVVKTDSQGNEEWMRRYGNPIYREGRITEILLAQDSTYYISGGWAYGRNSTGSEVYQKNYILKLDKDFNDVYELVFATHDHVHSYTMGLIESTDSNLIAIGHTNVDHTYRPRTTLHKITPQGDILWERQFVANNDTLENDSYGSSIKETADKGFVFGGRSFNSDFPPFIQRMWLVKTDSMGCDGTGDFWDDCTDVMVNEYVSSERFSIYPNPAKNNVQLTISNFQLSSLRGGTTKPSIEIYNLTGKMVKQIVRLSGDEASRGTVFSVDVSNLESGIYIVKVGQQTKKLIVE